MVESSDLQAAVQRTQAMERVQALQAQQEELNRKRFELELARESAEKGKKVQDSHKAEHKRVVRDRYEGDERPQDESKDERPDHEQSAPEDRPPDEEGSGRQIDVRV
jgi:hypothetical protein